VADAAVVVLVELAVAAAAVRIDCVGALTLAGAGVIVKGAVDRDRGIETEGE
jgi:hypothetical protein